VPHALRLGDPNNTVNVINQRRRVDDIQILCAFVRVVMGPVSGDHGALAPVLPFSPNIDSRRSLS